MQLTHMLIMMSHRLMTDKLYYEQVACDPIQKNKFILFPEFSLKSAKVFNL